MAEDVYRAGENGRRAVFEARFRDIDPGVQHRRPGRPSKLTPEATRTVCAAVAAGLSWLRAAELAHVDPATVHRWLSNPRPEYETLRQALRQAEAQAEVLVTANLVRQSRTSTRAGIYWLTTQHPNHWPPPVRARRRQAQLDRPAADPTPHREPKMIVVPIDHLTPETQALIAEKRAERERRTRGS